MQKIKQGGVMIESKKRIKMNTGDCVLMFTKGGEIHYYYGPEPENLSEEISPAMEIGMYIFLDMKHNKEKFYEVLKRGRLKYREALGRKTNKDDVVFKKPDLEKSE